MQRHKIAVLAINEYSADVYAATADKAEMHLSANAMSSNRFAMAREDLKCDIVIPYLHWAKNSTREPRPDQKAPQDAGSTPEPVPSSALILTSPKPSRSTEELPSRIAWGTLFSDNFPSDPPEWSGWVVILEVIPQGISMSTFEPSPWTARVALSPQKPNKQLTGRDAERNRNPIDGQPVAIRRMPPFGTPTLLIGHG